MEEINITKNINCGKAVEEYYANLPLFHTDILLSIEFEKQWLDKNSLLFESSINKSEHCHWRHLAISEKYNNIKHFANLYDGVLDTFENQY